MAVLQSEHPGSGKVIV